MGNKFITVHLRENNTVEFKTTAEMTEMFYQYLEESNVITLDGAMFNGIEYESVTITQEQIIAITQESGL